MEAEEIKAYIEKKLGANAIAAFDLEVVQPWLQIEPAYLFNVCNVLYSDPNLYFDFLSCLSGVDYGEEVNKVGVVYHLMSIPHEHYIVLKCIIERETEEGLPSIPSVSSLWKTAEWHEREAYDLVGIHFEGHPDLRRILLSEDWEGHPLRKDYATAKNYHGVKIDY